jgi:hypothetical protein
MGKRESVKSPFSAILDGFFDGLHGRKTTANQLWTSALFCSRGQQGIIGLCREATGYISSSHDYLSMA